MVLSMKMSMKSAHACAETGISIPPFGGMSKCWLTMKMVFHCAIFS
jgi:hypothetical protein